LVGLVTSHFTQQAFFILNFRMASQGVLNATHGINTFLLHMAFIDPYVKQIQITLPAVLGVEQIENILLAYLEILSDHLVPSKLVEDVDTYYAERLQVLKRSIALLPEHILAPDHLLAPDNAKSVISLFGL